MKVATPEILLALRAPNAGWLAALLCALDEAQRDPDFSAVQRDLVHRLLDSERLAPPVVAAAHERLARFEDSLRDTYEDLLAVEDVPAPTPAEPKRPKLTLCVANG